MSMIIRDPLDSKGARVVGSEGRLRTASETLPIGSHETFSGQGYNINTGTINLTTGNESGLLYVLNTGANDMVCDLLIWLLGNSNITGVDSYLRVYRNPTAGTLLSGAALGTGALNRNYGSNNVPQGTILIGVEGSTITASDGVNVQSIVTPPARIALNVGSIVIPQNSSIAMSYEPPTGNTSQDVQAALQLYVKIDEI
jgi:hypothetical protein